MQEYLLGIDAGTSGVKAIVMDTAGVICGSGYQECDVITPRPSWAEQRPADWWDACDGAVRQAVAVSGVGRRIAGIGLSGQMQGSVLLRRDGTVADTCMIWMDQRSCGEAEELNARLTPEETMRYAANYCLPSFWAAKLLWLRRHQPEVFDSIRKVLFPKDYLRWKMTGEIASEVSDASCTWLLDLPSRQWSDRLFRTAGLSRELVPERLLESQDVAGCLLPDVAERWGLRPGIPVAAGAGDQEAGGVGMGVTRPGTICSTIGTSGVVFGCSAAPFIDPEPHGMCSQCHAVPGQYSFLGCTLGAGGSFKWMRDTFFAPQKEALAARGESIYDYMTGLAAEQQPGCGGLVFLPYLGGEGTPYVDPNARGVFFGLSYQSDLGALCRAVMEGVTFSLRDTVEIIRAAGVEISQIRVAGGGAKSALWRQMQADIFGQSVCMTNVDEAPAAGAAILAGVAAGLFPSADQACQAMVQLVSTTEPIAAHTTVYNEYYQTYRGLYQSLRQDFARQAELAARADAALSGISPS